MLNPLYQVVAWLIVHIHVGLAHVFPASSGASWALSIVLLTMAMRLLLFPLFVKQIKAQRQLTILQPKIKELQAKHKGDKEKLNTELMALYREHGANPLAGCLPLVVQIPVFIALFHVLNKIQPTSVVRGAHVYKDCIASVTQTACSFHGFTGMSGDLVRSAARAKIFGAPVSAAFTSHPALLKFLGADPTIVKVLAAVMIVIMGLTTFITQRQLMARNAAQGQVMPGNQKALLYILPFTFGIFGFRFPLGVLCYWLTTNIWSMAQQAVVIRRMGPGPALALPGVPARRDGAAKPAAKPGPAPPSSDAAPSSTAGELPPRGPESTARPALADGPAPPAGGPAGRATASGSRGAAAGARRNKSTRRRRRR